MTQKQIYGYRLLRSLFISGVIPFIFPVIAIAQRIPIADETLGNERSVVSSDEVINNRLSNRINGGARRGANLFHSFREFNIDNGRGAYFTNPDGVVNILARVTGGTQSDILGTLGVDGSANLFLLNPNGILFGPNAQLDLRGPFIASTANSFLFDNGFAFSATDPQAPPLLTVSVPMGLQYGGSPGEVRSQGTRLEVLNGQTLTLAGGTVNINGGRLRAPGGRIELASMAAPGEVGLTQQEQEWRLSVPDGLARADVVIGNGASVDVSSDGDGSIGITARNLTITGARRLVVVAGIARGLGTVGAQAGDIDINATEAVQINSSGIGNIVQRDGTGNAGDINITAGVLSLNEAQAVTSTLGQGNAGNITIRARDTVSIDGNGGGVISSVEGVGQGGNIRVTTGSFSLTNGSNLIASTLGRGDAGNINITARDTVSFDGVGSNGIPSAAFVSVTTGAIGQGGNITITTSNLSFTNGGLISAITFGQGDAGNIIITARDTVSFKGEGVTSNDGILGSGIYAGVDPGIIGRGGDIQITTGVLSISGGVIRTETQGQGDAGNITITARDAVYFDGVGRNEVPGVAFSAVSPTATGQGGDISITTGRLSFTNGASVNTSTFGRGDAGNITITARDAVSFSGTGINILGNVVGSGTYSSVESGAIGQGGDIRITADSLAITNGAQVNAATAGQGRAGDIVFNTPTLLVSGGAQVLAETSSPGNGGSIVVNAPTSVNLRRTNNLSPVLSVETSGAGEAGDITINTPSLILAERARITATATATATNPQGGGSVTINASNLNLAGIVGVVAETQGRSPAGTLRLNPYRNQPNLDITLTPRSEISASTSSSGRGGDLIVTAPRAIAITGPGRLAVETTGTGNAGNMRFTTQRLTLSDGVELSASTSGIGQAGDIGINADVFTLREGAQVSTNTSSRGPAGNLTIQVNDQLLLNGRGTGLFASTASGSTGNGGNIAIDPELVQLEDGATIAVDSQGRGIGGNITLRSDQLVLNQSSITAETDSTQGGNITLQVPDVFLLHDRSRISTTAGTAQAGGDGGNVTVNGQFIVAVPDENSDIRANAFTGQGGNVSINAESILGIEFRSQPTPLSDITASSRFGAPGVVSINTPDVDPNRGLVQLPTDITDASRLIAQTCPSGDVADTQSNEFVITGRGGLPPTPNEAVNPDAIQVDLVTANIENEPSNLQHELNQNVQSLESPVVEAQGWQVATTGEVMLVAAHSQHGSNLSPNRSAYCHSGAN